METSRLSPTEERADVEITNEDSVNVDFFGLKGVVHPEFFPPSQTVNQNFQNA
jgi:hypothetical protein